MQLRDFVVVATFLCPVRFFSLLPLLTPQCAHFSGRVLASLEILGVKVDSSCQVSNRILRTQKA